MIPFGVVQSGKAAPAPVTCVFPLDATEAELQGAGLTAKLTPSNADQTGSYTIQSGLGSAQNYGMAPDGFTASTSQDIDVSSGIVAIGLSKDQLPDVGVSRGSSTGDVFILLRLVDKGTLATVADLQYGIDSTGSWISNNNSASPINFYTTDGSQASIYFDAGTGNWGFGYKDASSVEQTTVEGTFAASNIVPVLIVVEQASVGGGFAGQAAQATYHSVASGITAPVPSGAADPCGNAI